MHAQNVHTHAAHHIFPVVAVLSCLCVSMCGMILMLVCSSQKEEYGGILAMCGTSDSKQSAVVLTSHSQENIIRMHGLPDFEDRGQLSAIKDARALAALPGGMIAVGDAAGTVKTWQWR